MLFFLAFSLVIVASSTANSLDAVQSSRAIHLEQMQLKVRQSHTSMASTDRLRVQSSKYSDTGFVYMTMNSDAMCRTPFMTLSYPVNHCNVGEDSSFKYQVVAGVESCEGGVIQFFSDRTCTKPAGSASLLILGLSCEENDGESFGEKAYSKFSCNTSETPKLSQQSVVTAMYSNNTACAAESVQYYYAYSASMCMQTDSAGSSWQYACSPEGQPTVEYFTSNEHCQGFVSSSITLPTTCQLASSGGFNSDPHATNGSSVTYCAEANAPTAQPTVLPGGPHVVEFSVKQVISGLSLTAYNKDPQICDFSLIQTIASSMTGVSPEDIKSFAVSAGSGPATTTSTTSTTADTAADTAVIATGLLLPRESLSPFTTTESTVLLSYTVQLHSAYTTAQLIVQLTTSLGTGAFNALLHEVAVANGATQLLNAYSTDIEATSDDSDSNSVVLGTGAIVGIVVGGVAALVLVCVGAYCVFFRRKSAAVAAV